ncbi:MAG TPA: hypothetical protein VFB13_16985 [Reyranella sp.]|nr:hypothetical protein [Reyranella sp.]
MTSAARLILLLLAVAGPVMAQSAPPDLQPKLGSGPVDGKPVADRERPKLQDPPRPPVTRDGATIAPAAAPSH